MVVTCEDVTAVMVYHSIMSAHKETYVLAGETFHRLTAMENAELSRDVITWQCSCGSPSKRIQASQVKCGNRKSCGCLRIEALKKLNTIHGLSDHPLYSHWGDVLRRCENSRNKAFKNYGGRGISVCDRWHDVQLFIEDIERDIGTRPDGLSLDRINNDGNYEPGNVRWATPLQQTHNRRRQTDWSKHISGGICPCGHP